MTATDYRRRASIAEKGESLWRAWPDRLEQLSPEGDLVLTVPYRNVRRVRLAFAPGRFQQTRYLMELSGQRSRLVLTNISFQGFGQFEDRSETFFPLVRQVVAGVEAASPAAEFMAGEQPALYWLMMAFNLFAFGMLALVVLFLPLAPGNVSASVIIKAVVIVFSLPLLMSWAVNSRPRRFKPAEDLDQVLAGRSK